MKYTTSDTLATATKVIPVTGVASTYVSASLYVTYNGTTTRYNATVINSTVTVAGSIVASTIDTSAVGIHRFEFKVESTVDLDTNKTTTVTVGRTVVQKVQSNTAITI